MKNKIHIFFYFFSIAFSSMEIGYNTIYLLNFDNLKNDFPYSHMEKALPDLIKENYDFRQDITIDYIESVNPNIEKYDDSNQDSIKAMIVNGRFRVINNNFHIEYEAYDMESWRQLVKRHFYCQLHDVACVYDAFIISMENNISPFLVDRLDVESTIEALEKAEESKNNKVKSGENDNLDEELEENINLLMEDKNYREFNLKKLKLKINKENDVLQNLSQILLQVLSMPYEVFIGDMEISDDFNNGSYAIKLPIKYSMMNLVKQELLASLPLNSYLNTDEEVIFQFSKEDFMVDDLFEKNMVHAKFQKSPVIYFMDKMGEPQFIIIDSWSRQNQLDDVKIKGVPVSFVNKFSPLYSITSGIDNVELAINTRMLDLTYDLLIPNENMNDYVKVVVKFMQQDEIKKLLERENE